ncbi:MAG: WXG100 family type VII secretion target [Peptostreptococcaceae bacterium]|nr:WXG100 family type VII secretion target [Peptostreptococcaceae bacterium]
MGLNINIEQVAEMKSEINTVLNNTSDSYDQIVNTISNISSDWSTEGSSAFIEKFKILTNTFENYSTSLKNIIDYLSETENQYNETTDKVKNIIQ